MILVTGASGFIGTSLCRRFAQKGRSARGTIRNAAAAGGLPCGIQPNLVRDLATHDDWEGLLQGIQTVIHLAGRVPKRWSDRLGVSRRDFCLGNIKATRELAQAALRNGVRRFIYLSTAQVHGAGRPAPYQESDPFRSEGLYAASKCRAEIVLKEIANDGGMEIVTLRPPVVYGPEVKGKFARLLKWINAGVPLPCGRMTAPRSMIYVENLVAAIDFLIDHPNPGGGSYMIKDGEDISVADLIRRLSFKLGVDARIFLLPSLLNHTLGRTTRSFLVDDGLFRRNLGWKPPYTLDEGLQEMVDWYRQVTQ